LLLWLQGSVSPQELRDRLLSDAAFEAALLDWLEQCHQGQFSITTEVDLAAELEEEYLDSRFGEPRVCTRLKAGARDPATVLPSCPPLGFDDSAARDGWYEDMLRDSDRVIFMSNRHDKHHGKGCWRGDPPVCRARFPRDLLHRTEIDRTTGAIRFRHEHKWLNTFNPVLAYLLRCNHDVTCLLSGTSVKAAMAYVTDYVTKTKLTTETFFETVRSV
ncbi:hypothetical protein OH76DRAFT_1301071, partial [Lentinus brumalis]